MSVKELVKEIKTFDNGELYEVLCKVTKKSILFTQVVNPMCEQQMTNEELKQCVTEGTLNVIQSIPELNAFLRQIMLDHFGKQLFNELYPDLEKEVK